MVYKILAITWKDALVRFSSKSEWLFFFILPVVFTLLLSGGAPQNGGDSRVRLVVVDQAASPLAQDLIAALRQSETVRPEVMSLAEADMELSQRRTSAVLVIPAGFSLDDLAGGPLELELRQRPNSTNAMVAGRAVQAVTGQISSGVDIAASSLAEAERIRPFESAAERQAYLEDARQRAEAQMAGAPDRLAITVGNTRDPVDWDPRANSSAGQLITWVFIPLIGLSGSFAYERQKGTLRRILISPTSKATFLFGTIFGQVVMALVQMLLLVGFGALVLKLTWSHDLAALLLILLASALAASALGTTLGTFVKTEGQASGLSVMLGMVMALLGGCWYPLELFPQVVQQAVHVLPTTWAMQGLLDLVLRGQGLAAILPEAGVLLGFAALFFTVGIWRFRYE